MKSILIYTKNFNDYISDVINLHDDKIGKALMAAKNLESYPFTFVNLTNKNDTVSYFPYTKIIKAENIDKKEDRNIFILKIYDLIEKYSNSEEGSANIKIGRFVRKVVDLYIESLPENSKKKFIYNDSDIETFTNRFKACYDAKLVNTFEVVTGKSIEFWYNNKNYLKVEKNSVLMNSCMRYAKCTKYFKMYSENPEVCSLLILRDKTQAEKIVGRALIWTLENGEKYLDRVYTVLQSDAILFTTYAKEKLGINLTYANQSSLNRTKELSVKVAKTYDKYPYMDTFIYKDPETCVISRNIDKTKIEDKNKVIWTLCSQSGTYGRTSVSAF